MHKSFRFSWFVAILGSVTFSGVCEECGAVGTEVHHIIHLTPENVTDPSIATNQENLKLLCNNCHSVAHHRFGGKREYYFDEEGNLIPYKK